MAAKVSGWCGGWIGVAMLLLAHPGAAQVAWDAPMMIAPGTPAGPSILLVEPHRTNELGVLGIWRAGAAPVGLGFRLGVAEDAFGDVSIFGGVDGGGTLHRNDQDFPLDVVWFAGGGVGIGGGDAVLSFPAGVSLGRWVGDDSVQVLPYLAPRIVLDAFLGDRTPDDDLDLSVAIDLGADFVFDPGWGIRFSGGIGDRDAVAVGVFFGPRR